MMNRVRNIIKLYLEYMNVALIATGFGLSLVSLYEQVRTYQIPLDFYAATSAILILALLIFLRAYFSVRRTKRNLNKVAPRRYRIHYRVWAKEASKDIFRLIIVIGAYEVLKAIYIAILSSLFWQE